MTNEKLDRINALARLAKERPLTEEELSERDALRKEYIAEWRRGAEQVLENTYIVTPDGKKTKLQKKRLPLMMRTPCQLIVICWDRYTSHRRSTTRH